MRLKSTLVAAAPRHARVLCTLSALLGIAAAHAGTLSYRGQFTADDDLFVTQFVLPVVDSVTATTLGYGGGIGGSGPSAAAGGFAPVLTLFMDGFGLIGVARGSSQVCGAGAGNADPVSGFCWDASLSAMLPAGSYTLVLSQDGNEPLGQILADGYSQTGQHDYTGLAYLGQAGTMFTQVDGTPRTGLWAMDVRATSLPEPSTWPMALLGFAGLALLRLPARSRH